MQRNGSRLKGMRAAMALLWVCGATLAPSVRAYDAASATAEPTTESLQRRIEEVEKRADEWRTRDSVFHFAGFADAGYADSSGGEDAFDVVSFNPILLYQYKDRVLFEGELETSVDTDGETEVELEYASVDVALTDHALLVAGKFLSPIGSFQQNVHPSWINKLASAPSGFGHDGAAPTTEVGVQLRGAFQFGDARQWTYALYAGNGPELEAEEGMLMAVAAEGFTRDADGSKVWGGRLSLIPLPGFELGVSAARGEAAVTSVDGEELEGEPSRDYDVTGADVTWKWGKSLAFRGEYVRQKAGAAAASVAPESGEWSAWFVQASYLWPDTKWEPVVRYGEFRSPDDTMEQDQVALGVNYVFAANVIAKASYEFNDGLAGEDTDRNRWLLQLAYGF